MTEPTLVDYLTELNKNIVLLNAEVRRMRREHVYLALLIAMACVGILTVILVTHP